MRFVLPFLFVLLAACADPAVAPVFSDAKGIGHVEHVLVATDRARNDQGYFSGARSGDIAFLDVQVSDPKGRAKGDLPVHRRNPNPAKHFVLTGEQSLPDRAAFRSHLAKSLQGHELRDVTIFVHGYNNAFSDGVFRAAQLRRDFDLPGVMVHYSWASAAHPLAYTHDRDSVMFARDGLEDLLRDVAAIGARNVILVGHSMGGLLVTESLRQIEIAQPGAAQKMVDGVVLVSPDIDLDVFHAQAARFAALPQPFAIFVSQRDYALKLSARLNGTKNRLGLVSDPAVVAQLPVTLIDVSDIETRLRDTHFAPGSSSALISMIRRGSEIDQMFSGQGTRPGGGVPGAVVTVRNATQVILSPGLVRAQRNLRR